MAVLFIEWSCQQGSVSRRQSESFGALEEEAEGLSCLERRLTLKKSVGWMLIALDES
jgi:hypothetical protein